jgi:xylan 1,4-beta-xylosidase
MIGPRKVLVNGGVDISKKPIWIEGPHIYKVNGWYYLNCAEGGTGPQHSQVILRSKNVDGPYTPWEKNPILTQRDLSADVPDASTCTGHADLVIGPDNNWWAVFLAVRPYQGRFSPMGRETYLLPVKWTEDGWPVIRCNPHPHCRSTAISPGATISTTSRCRQRGSCCGRQKKRGGRMKPENFT